MVNKNKGYVVTHTHWDREWRYPIWENRMLLVGLMDELLNVLDTDPDYRQFLLDGQSVVIEDYLEVRPENESRVIKYIKEGKIGIGPWYTLPDLYPLDGECLIRNLLKGIRYSQSLGRCVKVAYESFGWGQISQFPQIYKGFGLESSVIAKHLSAQRAPESEFLWEGPDGTRILATRLGTDARANFFMNAYISIMFGLDYASEEYKFRWENGGLVYHQADEENHIQDYFKLINTESLHKDRIKLAVEKAWEGVQDTVLKNDRVLMNGSDSTSCQPSITEIIRQANKLLPDKELVFSTLEEYMLKLQQSLDYDKLQVVKGELRDGPANSCSANALATRPRIKILNKKVQNQLLFMAEPLSVFNAMTGGKYDSNFLDKAIKYMLLAHPHDSINGVTQDKTADDVTYMLNQALEISEVISNSACHSLLKKIDTSCFEDTDILIVVVNPSPFARSEIVKLYIDTPQEFNMWEIGIEDLDGNQLRTQTVSRKEETIPVNDPHTRPWPFYADRHCLYLETEKVPAGGYKVLRVVPKSHFRRSTLFWSEMRRSKGDEISSSPNTMENDYLRVIVNGDGTLSLEDKTNGKVYDNLNYFEDTGDCGDYWIYYPPYHNKTYTSLGGKARIWLEDNGLLSATIAAEVVLRVPAYALRSQNGVSGESRRAEEEKDLIITSYYTLKRDSKKVDVKLKVNNTAEDHRLRVLFDTGINAKYADAAGHFTVDRRPVRPLNSSQEFYPEMQTLPQQYFIDLSDCKYGIAIVNNCLSEYEAFGNKEGTLALTLVRSVRNIICTESRSAGRFPAEKGGQSLGMLEYEYALYPHKGDWQSSEVYQQAQRLNIPFKIIQTNATQGGTLPTEYSFLEVDTHKLVLSACKKAEDRDSFILRLFNPYDHQVAARVKFGSSITEAHLTTLNEERQTKLDSKDGQTLEIIAESNKIITIEFVLK